ncbi:MAG: PCRF domain-containing protein, partial [Caldimonas sp.]
MRQQLERLSLRLGELDALLADGKVAADMKRYRELGREHAEASMLIDLFRRYEGRERDRASAHELLAESAGDDAMVALAREESQGAGADLERLLGELQAALLP